jgi:hypothetical protein
VRVLQVRTLCVVDEVGDPDVPVALAVVVDEVPVEMRPDELLAVRRPVGVVVVLALRVRAQLDDPQVTRDP